MEIDRQWEENYFIVKANLEHENVHSGLHYYTTKNKYVCSDVTVYSDKYDLYGVVDCLEFTKDFNGSYISFLNGKYRINIVEYKPKLPVKSNENFRMEDVIQIYGQKICIDEIYHTNCSADFFYNEEKRRKHIPFEQNEFIQKCDDLLKQTIESIKHYQENNQIPQISKNVYCSGCSFESICLPKTKNVSEQQRIQDLLKEVEQ